MSLPDQPTLRRLLDYDPETGELRWRARSSDLFAADAVRGRDVACRTWNRRYAGKPAFGKIDNHGYRAGKLFHVSRTAHRIIWKWMTGEEPPEIDHINGDRTDNRWFNLRSVTTSLNRMNQRQSARNRSGVTGVHFEAAKGKWVACMQVSGRRFNLGCFDRFDDAVAVRRAAEKGRGFGPNHGAPSGQNHRRAADAS
jgi:hypothetical protein